MWDRWQQHAFKHPDREAIIHWNVEGEPFRWTYGRLLGAAETLSAELINRGICRGDVCALMFRHNDMLCPLYLACVHVGVIPAILAYPNPRLHVDKFRQGLDGMSQRSGLDWILTERDLEPSIRPVVENAVSTIKGMHFPLEWDSQSPNAPHANTAAIHEMVSSSDPLLLQHSSGTTGLQKPVVLSHAAVHEHVIRYGETLDLQEGDKIVSWLPLYHDMGLIAAFHLPLALGVPTVQINAFDWVLAPSILLEAVSKERGTISWLPNFAFDMMADKIRVEELDGIDLRSWRMIINCSEPVRHESHEKFLARFGPLGCQPAAISACYAMAETTFAVTQVAPSTAPPVLTVDRNQLAQGRVSPVTKDSPARHCVSSGTLVPGTEVRIVDPSGVDLADGALGEIAIKSASMFDGYRNYPEKTAAVLRNGWYYSGDLGFRFEGHLYVIGRKKDVIIVAGNNVYPEDVESALVAVSGVIPGRAIAFGQEVTDRGTEQLCVMVETSLTDESDHARLRMEIVRAGMAIDVSIAKVYVVPPRFLIKSSSGKPSRQANKDRAEGFN